jgi:hypothetical protein
MDKRPNPEAVPKKNIQTLVPIDGNPEPDQWDMVN